MSWVDQAREDVEQLAGLQAHAGNGYRLVQMVTHYVRAYTRDCGFAEDGTPDPRLAAVIVSAAARMVENPTGRRSVTLDGAAVQYDAPFGFNLVELMVLNGFRKRAA